MTDRPSVVLDPVALALDPRLRMLTEVAAAARDGRWYSLSIAWPCLCSLGVFGAAKARR